MYGNKNCKWYVTKRERDYFFELDVRDDVRWRIWSRLQTIKRRNEIYRRITWHDNNWRIRWSIRWHHPAYVSTIFKDVLYESVKKEDRRNTLKWRRTKKAVQLSDHSLKFNIRRYRIVFIWMITLSKSMVTISSYILLWRWLDVHLVDLNGLCLCVLRPLIYELFRTFSPRCLLLDLQSISATEVKSQWNGHWNHMMSPSEVNLHIRSNSFADHNNI